MTLTQFIVNLLLGVLGYAIAAWFLAHIEFEGRVAFVIAFIVGVLVFLSNFAARLGN